MPIPLILGLIGLVLLIPLALGGGLAIAGAVTAGLAGLLSLLIALLIVRVTSRVKVGVSENGRRVWQKAKLGVIMGGLWTARLRGYPIGRWAIAGAVLAPIVMMLSALLSYAGASLFAVPIQLLAHVVSVVAAIALIVLAVRNGRELKAIIGSAVARRRRIAQAVQFITGMSDAAWADVQWDAPSDDVITVFSPPAAVAGAVKNIDRVAQVLPDYVVDRERSGQYAVLRLASENERRRTDISAAFEGMVLDAQPEADGTYVLTLAPKVSPTEAERIDELAAKVFAAQDAPGMTLLEWKPKADFALVGPLSGAERSLRDRIAKKVGGHPHEVTVNADEDYAGVRAVRITRSPMSRAGDHASRVSMWRNVMLESVPGSHADWDVTVDALTDEVVMSRRERRVLPATVALANILPEHLSPDDWASIPIGLDPENRPQGQDLQSAPMAAWAGATGSGKTVGLLADMAQRVMRGHDVLVIDPTKGGVDFGSMQPYTRGFARTFDQAVTLIKMAYDEGVRRKGVLLREQEVKWSDLSPAVRAHEDIHPMSLYMDELASLLIAPVVPKGLDKEHTEVLNAQELAGQKALLSLYVGKVARELRFVGVFLVVAMQRPDASILGGEIRSNLSHRVQLVAPGKAPGQTELQMLYPAHIVPAVYDEINRFDDGHSRGLAVTAGEEGDVTALRVAYSPMKEIPALLEARGVQPVAANRMLTLDSVAESTAEGASSGKPLFDSLA